MTSPSFNNFGNLTVTNRDAPAGAQQPDPAVPLETGGRRIRNKVMFWNGEYFGVQTVEDPATNNNAIRFYEAASGASIAQEVFISHPSLDLFYPSIAVSGGDGVEDIVIGFTASGPNAGQYASTYAIIGQTAGGATNFSSPFLTRAGTATYERLDTNGRNRWGDYSATVVDPNDPRVFWTIQERATGSTSWSTQITQILLDGVPNRELVVELNPFGDASFPNGNLFSAADTDTYYFASDQSGNMQIDVTEDVVGFDVALRLWNEDELELANVDLDSGVGDDAQLTENLTSFDMYLAEVFSENGSGDFQIEFNGPTQLIDAVPLDADGDATMPSVIGALTDADHFSFVAPATANGSLDLNVSPSAGLDAVLTLYDSTGATLSRADSGFAGDAESINFNGVVPGETYYARVGGFRYQSNGGFDLDVDFDLFLPTAWTALVEGYIPFHFDGTSNDVQSFDAFINFVGDTDSYYISGDMTWDTTYTFEVGDFAVGLLNPVAAVYDSTTLDLIAFDNDSGIDDDASITLPLLGWTRYILVVADAADETGDLSIDVTAAAATVPFVIPIDAAGNGSDGSQFVSAVGDTDFFEFTAPAAANGTVAVTVTPTPNTLDTAAFLFDLGGNELARLVNGGPGAADNAVFNGVVPLTTYYLSVLSDDYLTTGNFVVDVAFGVNPVLFDFNGDGLLDCDDVDALVAQIVSGVFNPIFDLNSDLVVDTLDLDVWLAGAAAMNGFGSPYKPGDANLDGTVDGVDFVIWNTNKFTNTPGWCSGDFNADGVIDGFDFLLWNLNKFTSSDESRLAGSTPAGTSLPLEDRELTDGLRRPQPDVVPQAISNVIDSVFETQERIEESREPNLANAREATRGFAWSERSADDLEEEDEKLDTLDHAFELL